MTETTNERREAYARIIDPLVFELADALHNAEGEPEQLRHDATAMRDERMTNALAKADAILAHEAHEALTSSALGEVDLECLPPIQAQFLKANIADAYAEADKHPIAIVKRGVRTHVLMSASAFCDLTKGG